MSMRLAIGLVLATAAAALPATALAGTPRPLGGNVNGQTDYGADFAFVDAYLTAGVPHLLGEWGNVDLGSPAPLDSQGWPKSDFGVYINEVAPQPGRYTVTGTSATRPTVRLSLTPGSVGALTWNAITRTFSVPVTVDSQGTPGTDGRFILTFTNTGGGVRNLRVLRPGYTTSHPTYTSQYVNFLKAHKPTVLRMMDLTGTNNNVVSSWSQRTQPGQWGMRPLTRTVPVDSGGTETLTTERGMAWEYVIDLCNAVRTDCWINIPFHADDDYVRRLAALVKARLNPTLKVWVEYSNELWNDGFWQTHVNRALAVSDAQAGRGRLAYDGETNPVSLGDRRVAWRIASIGSIFKSAFGSSASRVRPVLAYQFANPDRTRNQLEYLVRTRGPVKNTISALAVAPYVNLGYASDWSSLDVPGLTSSGVLSLLGADVDKFAASNEMPTWVAMARTHGLQLTAYEGGPDTFGGNNVDAKTAATLSPAMQGLVERYLHAWYAQGGGQFNWYTLGADPYGHPFGTWSISNSITRTDSPKSVGFINVRNGN